jgi:hypothetical protein
MGLPCRVDVVFLLMLLMFPRWIYGWTNPGLSLKFYDKTCPQVETVVQSVFKQAVQNDRTLVGSLLRMAYHDCFVQVQYKPKNLACSLSFQLEGLQISYSSFLAFNHFKQVPSTSNSNRLADTCAITSIPSSYADICEFTMCLANICNAGM